MDMLLILVGSVLGLIYKSLEWIWINDNFQRNRKHLFSFENFLLLIITYVILLVGFGFIYTMIEASGTSIILESGNEVEPPFLHKMGTGMYFSAVTLFSLGYGDVVPIGVGRPLAVLEALIGYLLPAAFVMRTVIDFEGSLFKERG
ncbi:potassium channel family protein [Schinkia azotoformans]|nr:potassium channel family protein [Schinkia azotoformans]MEC1778056.1 potassium channel family protein [Schinkia azotoformans]MED4328116.1 potassium channel family protein [Schinkia azotoformans]